jgi:GntR family transcriptional regulator
MTGKAPAATMTATMASRRRRWRRRARLITPNSRADGAGASPRSPSAGVSTGDTDATMASTMLSVKIDRRDPALLHDQVAAEIRRAIADGEAKPGGRLPPARDLAAVLGVNTNTVLRALRLLRDEGLLEFRRGHAVKVAGTPERTAVLTKATELLQLARHHGFRREELIELIQRLP